MSISQFIRYLQGERRGMGSQLYAPTREQKTKSLFFPSIVIPMLVLLADVSFYQEAIDFVKMKTAGIRAVIIRAGQRTWLDIKFVVNWLAAKLAGLPRGSYWFYDSRETPEKQAALWWNQVKGDVGELFHVADFEESYGGAYGTKVHFKTFISEFQRLSGLPDKKIVVYTGFYWWNERVGNDVFFRRFRLWLAWYAAAEVVRVPAPWTASDLILWQYTSSGDGLKYGVTSKEIDLDWYNGTPQQFAAEFGAEPPVEPPTGENDMIYVNKIGAGVTSLRARTSPDTSSENNVIAGLTFKANDIVVCDALADYGGASWRRIRMAVRAGVLISLPATGEVWASDGTAGAYMVELGSFKTDMTNGGTVDLTQVLDKLNALLSASNQEAGALAGILSGVNDIPAKIDTAKVEIITAIGTGTNNPPPTVSDGYTGPTLGYYRVISTPDNQDHGNDIALQDSDGNDSCVLKTDMYNWLTANCPGFSNLVGKKVVRDDNGLWHYYGFANKGEIVRIARTGMANGHLMGQIVGMDLASTDGGRRGAINLGGCNPTSTPHYFHKIQGFPREERAFPIVSPVQKAAHDQKGILNMWGIRMDWLEPI